MAMAMAIITATIVVLCSSSLTVTRLQDILFDDALGGLAKKSGLGSISTLFAPRQSGLLKTAQNCYRESRGG